MAFEFTSFEVTCLELDNLNLWIWVYIFCNYVRIIKMRWIYNRWDQIFKAIYVEFTHFELIYVVFDVGICICRIYKCLVSRFVNYTFGDWCLWNYGVWVWVCLIYICWIRMFWVWTFWINGFWVQVCCTFRSWARIFWVCRFWIWIFSIYASWV